MKIFRGRKIDWTLRLLSCHEEKRKFLKISEFRRTKSILRPRKHLMEPYEKLGFCSSSSLFSAKIEFKNLTLLFTRELETAVNMNNDKYQY